MYSVNSKMSSIQQVVTARACFHTNQTKPLKFRKKQLQQFKKFLQIHEEQLIDAMEKDMRKPREEGRLEVLIGVNHVRYLLNNFEKWAKPEKARKRMIDLLDGLYVYSDPYGVVLVVGAWNVPLLTLLPVTGAIAAGNCVVIKPSHNSPNFSEFVHKTLPEYLDPECYPVLIGDVAFTNTLLQQRFDYIYFTGSTTTAKLVHQAANKYLTPTTLELGGKNAVYIHHDADIRLAARRIMWGKCFNAGQACISPDYVLCTKEIEKIFIKEANSALEEFFGVAVAKSCPIINAYHFQRLVNLLKGLNIALGGEVFPEENYIAPTIAVDVKLNDSIMQEEIFGPILPIITVENVEQAVKIINRSEKALALYVFTQNNKIRDFVIENTSSGGVTVNDTLMHLMAEELPFGGVGMSGMGCYKGKFSFDTFVHKKSVLIKRFNKIVEIVNVLRYPPYSHEKSKVISHLLKSRKGVNLFTSEVMTHVFVFVIGILIGILIFYCFFK